MVNGETKKNAINIFVDPSMKADAYDLTVEKNAVNIKGGSSKAVFYAMQSLRQMMPVDVEKGREDGSDQDSKRADSGRASVRVPGDDAGCVSPFLHGG